MTRGATSLIFYNLLTNSKNVAKKSPTPEQQSAVLRSLELSKPDILAEFQLNQCGGRSMFVLTCSVFDQ